MGELTLSGIAETMKDIDFCMLTTVTDDGKLSSRPMSNNRDVEYDGDSWFFAYDDARFIQDVKANDQVGLTFAGDKSLLGKPGICIRSKARPTSSKTASLSSSTGLTTWSVGSPRGSKPQAPYCLECTRPGSIIGTARRRERSKFNYLKALKPVVIGVCR